MKKAKKKTNRKQGAPAAKGNKFWEKRSKHGRNAKYSDSIVLWDTCSEYFEYVVDNPLTVTKKDTPKMQAMTLNGLCIYLGICINTWKSYRKNDNLASVVAEVEEIIYHQKFIGAAAGFLNQSIIARDLGLSEKQENDNKHSFDFSNMSDDALRRIIESKSSH